MSLYYKDLWPIIEAEIERAVKNGDIKPEDKEEITAYNRRWLDWPGWDGLKYEGKTYYRSFKDKVFHLTMGSLIILSGFGLAFTIIFSIIKMVK